MSEFSPIFLGLVTLLIINLGSVLCDSPSTEKCEELLDKLEAIADGSISSSSVTIQELKDATAEYSSWPPVIVRQMRDIPEFHLIMDFVLIPMTRFDEIIDYDDLQAQQEFLEFIVAKYKSYRPLYLGESAFGSYLPSPKIEVLMNSMLDLKDEVKRPVTIEMVFQARKQYEELLKRVDQIGLFEDIFGCEEELRGILNGMNQPLVKALHNSVLTLVKPEMTDRDIPYLIDAYKKELAKDDFFIKDGGLVKQLYE